MGIASVDLTLEAITLVGGWNGAGKSSLLEATACAVTGTPLARGIPTKGKATALLREGAEAGSVSIKHERGTVRVDWPAAEVKTEGGAVTLGSALGIGARRWMDLDGKERMAELATRLALEPTEQDILAWLKSKDHVFRDDKKKDITAMVALSLFTKVQDQGWDAAWKTAREFVTKRRGAWEHVTGEKYGSTKSANWRPKLLEPDETYTIEGVEAKVAEAKDAYEETLRAGAVTSDQIAKLEAVASRLPDLSIAADTAEAEVRRYARSLEKEREDLEKLPAIGPAPNQCLCPHCGKAILVKQHRASAAGVSFQVEAPPTDEGMTANQLKAAKLKREAAINAIAELKEVWEAAQATRAAALRAKEEAEKAATQLAIERARPQVDAGMLGQAKAALTEAETIRDAVKAMIEGRKIYAEIARTLPLIDALAPDGVRAAKVAQGLAEFNAELAALSETAKFKPVQVTPEDAAATLDGRPYALLSESERWRCDLILSVALARREKAALILVDRLDILHPQARPGVLYLLRDVCIPALVGMTAKDKAALPALEQHGLGKTIWLENGAIVAA